MNKTSDNLPKTEVRIRLRNQKAIDLYNQFLGKIKSQTITDNSKVKHSLNEILEVNFTKFLEHYLLDEQFDSIEEKLINVIQPLNKRSRNNVYTFVDSMVSDIYQIMTVNEKKLSFFINIFAEKFNLALDELNNPHEQLKNDLDWVRSDKKKYEVDRAVWCQNRKKERKKYES